MIKEYIFRIGSQKRITRNFKTIYIEYININIINNIIKYQVTIRRSYFFRTAETNIDVGDSSYVKQSTKKFRGARCGFNLIYVSAETAPFGFCILKRNKLVDMYIILQYCKICFYRCVCVYVYICLCVMCKHIHTIFSIIFIYKRFSHTYKDRLVPPLFMEAFRYTHHYSL